MKSILMAVGMSAALAATAAFAGEGRHDHEQMSDRCSDFRAGNAADGAMTPKQAKRYVAAHLPGKVTEVRADARDAAEPHYHVDVRLPQGAIARLNVEASSGKLSWREPAILQD